MGDKYNLQRPKLKINDSMYSNAFFNISLKISNVFQGMRHYIVKLWEFFCVKQLTTGITQNLEPNNNLNVKTKCQNGVAQGAVFCHLLSKRKSASFLINHVYWN